VRVRAAAASGRQADTTSTVNRPAALEWCRSATHHSGRNAVMEKNAADLMITAAVSRPNAPH